MSACILDDFVPIVNDSSADSMVLFFSSSSF